MSGFLDYFRRGKKSDGIALQTFSMDGSSGLACPLPAATVTTSSWTKYGPATGDTPIVKPYVSRKSGSSSIVRLHGRSSEAACELDAEHKGLGEDDYSGVSAAAFCLDFISHQLGISPASDGREAASLLSDLCSSGEVLSELLNALFPGSIDVRAINVQHGNATLPLLEREENLQLCLASARAHGCRIGSMTNTDLAKGNEQALLTLALEIILVGLIQDLKVEALPKHYEHLKGDEDEHDERTELIILVGLIQDLKVEALPKHCDHLKGDEDEHDERTELVKTPMQLLKRWTAFYLEKGVSAGLPISTSPTYGCPLTPLDLDVVLQYVVSEQVPELPPPSAETVLDLRADRHAFFHGHPGEITGAQFPTESPDSSRIMKDINGKLTVVRIVRHSEGVRHVSPSIG
eukprot:gene5612-2610_t